MADSGMAESCRTSELAERRGMHFCVGCIIGRDAIRRKPVPKVEDDEKALLTEVQ